jgi:hypothetical protein
MKVTFRMLGVAIALATPSLVSGSTDGRAEAAYPWCAISSMSMGTQTCSFASLDQCRAYVAPLGFCQPSARYTSPPDTARSGANSRSRPSAARRDLF